MQRGAETTLGVESEDGLASGSISSAAPRAPRPAAAPPTIPTTCTPPHRAVPRAAPQQRPVNRHQRCHAEPEPRRAHRAGAALLRAAPRPGEPLQAAPYSQQAVLGSAPALPYPARRYRVPARAGYTWRATTRGRSTKQGTEKYQGWPWPVPLALGPTRCAWLGAAVTRVGCQWLDLSNSRHSLGPQDLGPGRASMQWIHLPIHSTSTGRRCHSAFQSMKLWHSIHFGSASDNVNRSLFPVVEHRTR